MPDTSQLRIEYVKLSDLQHWPRNPKAHDVGALTQSVQRFGFVSPIIVDENTGRIVAGHGRVDLLTLLKGTGAEAPHRIVAADDEWLVPVVRGIAFADEHEAEAYLVADNQLTMLGGWNDPDLYDALKRQLDDGSLDGTGFDADDVDELRRRLESTPYGTGQDDEEEPQPTGPLSFTLYDRDTVAEHIFTFFRARGFPYRDLPLHTQMLDMNRLAACDQERALRTIHGYAVADTYHRHRFECHATDKRSPIDSFHDDAQLRRAINIEFDQGRNITDGLFPSLTLVASTQACSNFRPGLALHFYRRFGVPNGVVLDPCTGYGGRLLGWIASRLGGRYVGVDPNVLTHEANTRMAAMLAPPESVTLINLPFEDVDLDAQGLTGAVDFVFTSPPYFNKERYSDDDSQSFKRYLTFEAWRDGFLDPLLAGAFTALKPGGRCGINIADIRVRNRVFPLEEATRELAAKAGFELAETVDLVFQHHFGQGHNDVDEPKSEPLFIFRKPGGDDDSERVVRAPAATVTSPSTGRIEGSVLDAMFARAGLAKDVLYNALRQMGRQHLKRDLRDDWSPDNPTRNYCYVIAEFVHKFLAPRGSTAWRLEVPGDLAEHWFVKSPDGQVIDLAAEQFPNYEQQVVYSRARKGTFMPPSPSKRARLLAKLCGMEA